MIPFEVLEHLFRFIRKSIPFIVSANLNYRENLLNLLTFLLKEVYNLQNLRKTQRRAPEYH